MMKPRIGVALAIVALLWSSPAWADENVKEAQNLLKERGFYAGPVNGTLDADTQGAVRRFQLYSGLEGSGALDEATLEKLREREDSAPAEKTSEKEEKGVAGSVAPDPTPSVRREAAGVPSIPSDAASERKLILPLPITYRAFFQGTAYERSSEATQRKVVMLAEERLTRHRLYEGPQDGQLTDALEEALIRYQSRTRLPLSGRLDGPTLRALGLTAPAGAPPPPTMGPRSRAVYYGRPAAPGTPIIPEP